MVWRLTAVALFGLASIAGPVAATGAAVIGSALLWISFTRPDLAVSAGLTRIVVAVLTLTLVIVGARLGSYGFPEPAGLAAAGWVAGAVAAAILVMWPRSRLNSAGLVLATALILILAVGTVIQYRANLFGLDVYRSHEAAADALAAGENPYTDAVRVLDGSPNAEDGAVFEGYAYPPVTLVLFSLGDWVGGDPRWAAALAIAFGIAVGARASSLRSLGVLVVVVLAATPTMRWIVWSGSTEPVTFALLLGAVTLWRRPTMSGIVLGLALATKQYLVVLVPLVFLLDQRPWKRTGVAVSVAGLTLLPAFLADPEAFWFTMVERPLGLAFRPDTQSVSGALNQLGWRVDVPSIVTIAGVFAVSWAFVRTVRPATPAVFLGGCAIALSTTFLLSLAFTNYWWLVQWLTTAATVLSVGDLREERAVERLSPRDAV